MNHMINNAHFFVPKRGDFARFQFVDKQSEYVVFGYIRQIQRRIFNKEHIPTEISQICAIYYNPMEIKLGNEVDARDSYGKWYLAQINCHKKAREPLPERPILSRKQNIYRDKLEKLDGVYIHYLAWKEKWDEWIFINQNTICTCVDGCTDEKNHLLAMANTQTSIKTYRHSFDYDENGICYLLGTNFGQESWINPAKRGLIKLNSSGWSGYFGCMDDFVGRSACDSCTKDIKNGFVSIDFGANNIKIRPSAYTLRHDNDWNDYFLRDWTFSGSNDGNIWIIIRRHKRDYSFHEKGQSHTFHINCEQYYKHFKIEITGANSAGSWRICTTGFEIYGRTFGSR